MSNFTIMFKAALVVIGLAPVAVSAQTLSFASVPDSATMLDAQAVYNIYGGKTEDWGGGSYAYRAADGTFRAVNSEEGSVGSGRWYITTSGKMCYNISWYWPQDFGVKSKKLIQCSRYVRDEDGDLWEKDVSSNGPWLPFTPDNLWKGDTSLGSYNTAVKELGIGG